MKENDDVTVKQLADTVRSLLNKTIRNISNKSNDIKQVNVNWHFIFYIAIVIEQMTTSSNIVTVNLIIPLQVARL